MLAPMGLCSLLAWARRHTPTPPPSGRGGGGEGPLGMGPGDELLDVDPRRLDFPCQDDESKVVLRAAPHGDHPASIGLRHCCNNEGAVREAPPGMECKDKFLVQSTVASAEATLKDIITGMKEGRKVDEVRLGAAFIAPPRPPSPVWEKCEEGSSPRSFESGAWRTASREFTLAVALIRRLTEETHSTTRQTYRLRQEIALLRQEVKRQQGGFSLMFVLIVALLGILLGYFVET